MGLDQYLSKKTYVKNWDHMKEEEKHIITVKKGNKKVDYINPNKISFITEEIGYWRKANAIHNWFVKNVQEGNDDCKEYYVSKENLETLLETIKEVLKSPDLKAEALLPTTEGFFFGGTKYDDYYLETLKDSEKIIENAIKEQEKGGDIYYQSSW